MIETAGETLAARHAAAHKVRSVRAVGTRRLYAVDPSGLREVDAWVEQFRGFWEHRLEALATEVARGKRSRR